VNTSEDHGWVRTARAQDGTWAWSCDTCVWVGVGLPSHTAALREHERTAERLAQEARP
jgi:Zn-finger protein